MVSEQSLTYRDTAMAQSKLAGMTYREMAKKYNVSPARVCQVLQKSEIKDILDAGTAQMISMIPMAVDTHCKAMMNFEDNDTLAVKAAETILKTGAIIPSNTINATINTIYNQTNNIVTTETMDLVKKILPGLTE